MRRFLFMGLVWVCGVGAVHASDNCEATARSVCCGGQAAESISQLPICSTVSGCSPVQHRASWNQKLACCLVKEKPAALTCLSCTVYLCSENAHFFCRAPRYLVRSSGQLASRCTEETAEADTDSPTFLHESLDSAERIDH